MALSAQLGERGTTPEKIATSAAITFEDPILTRASSPTVTARGADKAKIVL